ncbi:MAG: hypothetical protein PWR09_554 [Archaeoglobi archaeon]|nr:hypothetical protein [Archaeoglobi archaeon]
MIEEVGKFFGKLTKVEDDGLRGLENGLKKFFKSLEDFKDFQFSSETEDGRLITKSKCPIYTLFPVWCEKFCVKFAEGFAKAYGVQEVKRVARQPASEWCVFEFGGRE